LQSHSISKHRTYLYQAQKRTDCAARVRQAAIKTVRATRPDWTGYFQKQVQQHCQLHAINNALGGPVLAVSPLEAWRETHQTAKWAAEDARFKCLQDASNIVLEQPEKSDPITGSKAGLWSKSTVFSVLRQTGFVASMVPSNVVRSSPHFLSWLRSLKGPHILYLSYYIKLFPDKKNKNQAEMQQVKHCVALLGHTGVILDSELGPRAIDIANYPHVSHIGSVYRLCPYVSRIGSIYRLHLPVPRRIPKGKNAIKPRGAVATRKPRRV
jgi:hypothetical protein